MAKKKDEQFPEDRLLDEQADGYPEPNPETDTDIDPKIETDLDPGFVTVNTKPVPFQPFLDALVARYTADPSNLIEPNHFKTAVEAAVHNATKPVIPGGFEESPHEIAAMIQAARVAFGNLHHANKEVV